MAVILESIKVSVITPTYNDEAFIANTIKSVLCQTHSNLELLIVDDCSTDKTVDVVSTFNDSRIRLLRNDSNHGAAFSRNKAIQEASGSFVAFLDGDDLWLPTKIEKQLRFMVDNGYDFTCTDYRLIDENGKDMGITISSPKIMRHSLLIRTNYIGCLTVMYKKSLFPNLSIPNSIKKRNDYALWLKLSEQSPCYCLKESLSIYRKRQSNSISSGKKRFLLKYHQFMYSELYGFSKTKSCFYSYRNIVFYLLKRLFYTKRTRLKK